MYLFGSPDRLIPKLLVPVQLHEIVLYTDGVARNLHRVPKSIVSKRIKGDFSLSTSEKFLTEGLSAINFFIEISDSEAIFVLRKWIEIFTI